VSGALDCLERFVNGRPQLPPQLLAALAAQQPQLLPALARRATMAADRERGGGGGGGCAAGGGGGVMADLQILAKAASILAGASGTGDDRLPPPSRACLLLAALARGKRTKAGAAGAKDGAGGRGGDGAAAGSTQLREAAARALRWRIKAGSGSGADDESETVARQAAAAALRILTQGVESGATPAGSVLPKTVAGAKAAAVPSERDAISQRPGSGRGCAEPAAAEQRVGLAAVSSDPTCSSDGGASGLLQQASSAKNVAQAGARAVCAQCGAARTKEGRALTTCSGCFAVR
jgi:hypothetical protein